MLARVMGRERRGGKKLPESNLIVEISELVGQLSTSLERRHHVAVETRRPVY